MQTHTHIHTNYTQKHTQLYTHRLKKSLAAYLLKKCLGGSDMKWRSLGNSLDELVLFFLKKYMSYYVWHFNVSCILVTL